MKIEHEKAGRLVVVDYNRRSASARRVVLVVDDNYETVATHWKESPEQLREWSAYRVRRGQGGTRNLSFLVPYFRDQPSVRELRISDFPRSGESWPALVDRLREGLDPSQLYVLIDCQDEAGRPDAHVEPIPLGAAEALRALKLPTSHFAFVTIGGPAYEVQEQLRPFGEIAILAKHEDELTRWWERAQRTIPFRSFVAQTDREFTHYPAKVAVRLGSRDVKDVLNRMANEDFFGVWRWVAEECVEDADPRRAGFVYLCGKYFVYGGPVRAEERGSNQVDYVALRGLVCGLRLALAREQHPPTAPAYGFDECEVAAEVAHGPAVVDKSDPWGRFQFTDGSTLENFSSCLYNFLYCFPLEGARVDRLGLTGFASDSAELRLEFSQAVSPTIFSGATERRGTMGRLWDALSRNVPEVRPYSDEAREIVLRFPKVAGG